MESFRAEVLEYIAIALAELRGVAQPREHAELRELEFDAEDAENDEQLQKIFEQAKNLRTFCERRKLSAEVSGLAASSKS